MEALFTKVSESYQPSYREKLVFLNLKNRQVSLNLNDFKSAWSPFSKPTVEAYLAKLKTEARGSTGQFRLDDFSTGKNITLTIEYLIQINESQVESALETYLRFSDLEKGFNDHIKDLVKDFSQSKPLVDAPDAYIPELQLYITTKLRDYEPGFSAAIRINLIDFIPQKEQIAFEGVKLRFQGGRGEIMVHFNAEVTIDNFNRDLARQSKLKDKDQLKIYLQELVRNFFLEQVNSTDFFNRSYRRSTLTEQLESHLNRELRAHGRKLIFFEFNENLLREHSAPTVISNLPVQVGCQVRHASKFVPLEVSTRITMELNDEGQAIIAGMTSRGALEGWAVKNIKEIVETAFLEQEDFADVVIAFFDGENNIERVIGEELTRRAGNIGYKLKYYNVLPNLSKYENKQVQVSVTDMVFTTKGGDIPLPLSFEVEGNIQSWRAIKEYLRPDRDGNLDSSIKEKTTVAIKEVLLANFADRLYLHFYEPYEEKPSVEKELQDKITKALEEFKLKDLKIRLIPVGNDIKTRFDKIRNKRTEVSVVFNSFYEESLPEDLYYQFTYSIVGITDFNVFYSSTKNLDINHWVQQLSESLRNLLMIFLETIDTRFVKYGDDRIRSGLEQKFKQNAIPQINSSFGLDIDIREFKRKYTEEEEAERRKIKHYIEEKEKTEKLLITEEFTSLKEAGKEEKANTILRLNELYGYGPFKTPEQDAEIIRLEKRLAELNNGPEKVVDILRAKYGKEKISRDDTLALFEASNKPLPPSSEQSTLKEKNEDTETE